MWFWCWHQKHHLKKAVTTVLCKSQKESGAKEQMMLLLNVVIVFGSFRFLIQDRFKFLLAHGVMGLVMSLMYALNGGNSGAIMSLASSFSSTGQAFLGESQRFLWRVCVALPAVVFVFFFKEDGWWAWLPVIAFVLARGSEALLNNVNMRKVLVLSSCLWMTYAFVMSLWVILIVEMIISLFGIITIVKLTKMCDKNLDGSASVRKFYQVFSNSQR